jgi:hypothetical protein
MLSHSIGTFRRFFPRDARFVVCTDDPQAIAGACPDAQVMRLDGPGAEYVDSRATWKKWAPRFRLDASVTEIRVDADIFLLDEPVELRRWLDGDGTDFIVTQEEFTELWPYGNFGSRLPAGFAPINAGFFGQRAGADLTVPFREAYRWWAANVFGEDVLYHDEQGALGWLLQQNRDRVRFLDPARYRVVCPLNEPPVETLDGIVAMHATYPEHPAFQRFREQIAVVSGVSAGDVIRGR